jgi:hypothetical protein
MTIVHSGRFSRVVHMALAIARPTVEGRDHAVTQRSGMGDEVNMGVRERGSKDAAP